MTWRLNTNCLYVWGVQNTHFQTLDFIFDRVRHRFLIWSVLMGKWAQNIQKLIFSHNFWLECPRDLRSTSLSCIFDAFFGDTPFGHIFFEYAHMPICPYGQIWAYGHVGIWAYAKKLDKWGIPEKSIKNATQRRWPQVSRTLKSKVMAKNRFLNILSSFSH